MRVLLVNKFWYPRGGAEKVVLATRDLLIDAGHEVEIFGAHHPENIISNDFFVGNVGKNRISPWHFIYNFEAREKFTNLLRTFRPDIVHFHNISYQLTFSLVDAVQDVGVPAVMTAHDYTLLSPAFTFFHNSAHLSPAPGKNYWQCVRHRCLGTMSRSIGAALEIYFRDFFKKTEPIRKIIVPSESLRQDFLLAQWSEPRLCVLPNPVSTTSQNFFCGIDDGSVVYVGRIVEEKGIRVFIEAARRLPEISHLIIGDGSLRESLQAQTRDMKNLMWRGEVGGKDLTDLLAKARMVVVPSLCRESFSLAAAEAMAMGKIVVASDLGAFRDLLPREFLVPAGEATALAVSVAKWWGVDASMRRVVGQKFADEIRQKNDPKIYAQKLVDIYSHAIVCE